MFTYRYAVAMGISIGCLVYSTIWNHSWILSTIIGFLLGIITGLGLIKLQMAIDENRRPTARRIGAYVHLTDGFLILMIVAAYLTAIKRLIGEPIYNIPFLISSGAIVSAVVLNHVLPRWRLCLMR